MTKPRQVIKYQKDKSSGFFVCVSQAPCWEGESPRSDTACSVVACIAGVAPVVPCIRLIPAAMHVCAVAEVVLAAVELRRVESSSSAVSCVVQLHPKLAGS
jgi:hypothetical protein